MQNVEWRASFGGKTANRTTQIERTRKSCLSHALLGLPVVSLTRQDEFGL